MATHPAWPELSVKRLPSLTADQMRAVDRGMTRGVGVQLIQMMEVAGTRLAELARWMLGGRVAGRRVVALCGSGNNGGGGMAAVRHLSAWGADGLAVLVGRRENLKPVPRKQWSILEQLDRTRDGRRWKPPAAPDLILDAIFGYGFHGEPPLPAARWIEWANQQPCPVLALDVPSGLDATAGRAAAIHIRADATLTLALPKQGLLVAEAGPLVGELYLADLAVPSQVYRDLGLEVGPLFAEAPIVRLVSGPSGNPRP